MSVPVSAPHCFQEASYVVSSGAGDCCRRARHHTYALAAHVGPHSFRQLARSQPAVARTGCTGRSVPRAERHVPERLLPRAKLGAQGFISSGNDVDAYRIEVLDFNTDVHVEMPQMPAAYALYLANWNGDEIATSTPNGSGGAVIDATVDIPGAYYIFVHSTSGASSAGRPYQLFRALAYPGSKIPDILFTSEFREGSKQATTGDTEFATHSESGGRYVIAMKVPGVPEDPAQAWWTGFGPEVTDFTMTLDARVVNQVDAGFRVFFRHMDNDNTYSLAVDAKDGQVLLMKLVNGESAGNTGWQPSSAVDTSGGVNRIAT